MGEVTDMRKFRLVPKSGCGCVWFCFASDIWSGRYVSVFSSDGFESVVDINDYDVYDC